MRQTLFSLLKVNAKRNLGRRPPFRCHSVSFASSFGWHDSTMRFAAVPGNSQQKTGGPGGVRPDGARAGDDDQGPGAATPERLCDTADDGDLV